MEQHELEASVAAIEGEEDLVLKAQSLAVLISRLFDEKGFEVVVTGGSAIEFYTAGGYMSGDIDLCFHGSPRPPMRIISETMNQVGQTSGTVRTYEICGLFVDILGEFETNSRAPLRTLKGPNGGAVALAKPEDLLPERVFIAIQPGARPEALTCAEKLGAVCASGVVRVDWSDCLAVADSSDYRIRGEFIDFLHRMRRILSDAGEEVDPALDLCLSE